MIGISLRYYFLWFLRRICAGLEIRRSEVRIPVLVQVFLLRSYNVKFPKANKLWVWFQLITWFEYALFSPFSNLATLIPVIIRPALKTTSQMQFLLTEPQAQISQCKWYVPCYGLCRHFYYKLKNQVLCEFLEKYIHETLPDESTIRKNHMPDLNTQTMNTLEISAGFCLDLNWPDNQCTEKTYWKCYSSCIKIYWNEQACVKFWGITKMQSSKYC